jgi:type 1 glutamine amidotransferase
MFMDMAARKGWDMAVTDRAGVFTPASLARFDAVIWNNVSGDVLTLSQRRAFRSYIEKGGGFVGVHGSGGDPVYFWNWYTDRLLGARFEGHPMHPQFQDARIVVGDKGNPAAAHLPTEWRMKDEWYSFKSNPRSIGAHVIATLDESSYDPASEGLAMGDHPIAWTNRIGRGTMFYSAIGHRPETYVNPHYVAMIEDALGWIVDRRKSAAAARKH